MSMVATTCLVCPAPFSPAPQRLVDWEEQCWTVGRLVVFPLRSKAENWRRTRLDFHRIKNEDEFELNYYDGYTKYSWTTWFLWSQFRVARPANRKPGMSVRMTVLLEHRSLWYHPILVVAKKEPLYFWHAIGLGDFERIMSALQRWIIIWS